LDELIITEKDWRRIGRMKKLIHARLSLVPLKRRFIQPTHLQDATPVVRWHHVVQCLVAMEA